MSRQDFLNLVYLYTFGGTFRTLCRCTCRGWIHEPCAFLHVVAGLFEPCACVNVAARVLEPGAFVYVAAGLFESCALAP